MCFYVECQTCSGAKFYVELFVEKQVLLWCCKAHESVRVLLPRSRAVFSSVKSAVHEAGVAGRFAPAETAGGTCPIRKRNGYNLAANQSTISGFSMVAFEKLKMGPRSISMISGAASEAKIGPIFLELRSFVSRNLDTKKTRLSNLQNYTIDILNIREMSTFLCEVQNHSTFHTHDVPKCLIFCQFDSNYQSKCVTQMTS